MANRHMQRRSILLLERCESKLQGGITSYHSEWPSLKSLRASLVARMVKKLPAKQETWVQSLGQEDPLEKGMASHSSILAWEIPFSSSHIWMWTIKKAECWRIVASELWCWRRLLRVPWTERRQNKSVLKEVNPEFSLEGLVLIWSNDVNSGLIGKDPDVGKDWKWEEKGTTEDEMVGWHHRLNWHEFE